MQNTPMKLFKLFSLILLLLLLCNVTVALAGQSQRYDVAYIWDADMHRVLEYREKLRPPLGPATDNQLDAVVRGKNFGIVRHVNTTFEQAKAAAEKDNLNLQRAGLQRAQPTEKTGYHPLYHISYSSGPSLAELKKMYSQIQHTLGQPAGDNLYIEKIDARNFTVVYRCWKSSAEALMIAKQHRIRLQKNKIMASLISAGDRPVAYGPSDLLSRAKPPSGRQNDRVVPSSSTLQGNQKKTGTELNPLQEQSIPAGTLAGINSRMEGFLRDQRTKGGLRQDERTAWVAYDLTNNTYVVSMNTYRPFQAASMIKPFVALAFFHQVDKGKLSYTPQHRQMMEAMIQHSDNSATNWFIRQIGGPAACEAIIRKEYRHLFRQVSIKEYIPPGGRTYVNSAQPSDYIQFLKALWNSQLPYSKELLRVMALPGRDRILCGTEVPSGTLVYNKTGTTAHLCGDMGILVPLAKDGRRIPYAIVGIVERPSTPANYEQWMFASGGVIRNFSSFIYKEMKQKYNLL